MSIGINGYIASAVVKITVDGGAAIEKTIGSSGATDQDQSYGQLLLIGFATSIKVEMKLGAVGVARYLAFSLVE